MPAAEQLAGLRRSLAAIDLAEKGFSEAPRPITFGMAELDAAVGGGLPRGALHEVFAAGTPDAVSASAFALAIIIRALEPGQKLVWVRQDMAARELGELYPPGLAEFGLDPGAVIALKVRDGLSALRAAHEALRCSALGAVALDLWGTPKALDLTATRRLARAAEKAGTPALLLRPAAMPAPSAAFSRWSVRTVLSRALPADAPGFPVFEASLLRHRAGLPSRRFRVEWDREHCMFRAPSYARFVAAPSIHRSAQADGERLRRAG